MASGSSLSRVIPVRSSPGEWKQLLQYTLGKDEGAAVATSLARREVIINVTTPEDQPDSKKTDQDTRKSGEASDSEVHVDVEAGSPARNKHDKSGQVVVQTEDPETVLHVVAAAGDSQRHRLCARKIHERASYLVTTAAPSSKGDTPLHCAARAGNKKMVALLTKLAAEDEQTKAKDLVRMQNKRGETALHEAIRFGTREMVKTLLSVDKGVASVVANDGTSPMYLGSVLGNTQMAITLHECGDEPSYSGPRGQNALHAAALHDHKEMTKLLLEWNRLLVEERGGDRNLVRGTDDGGSTPLHFAAAAPEPALQFTLFVFSASNFERYSFGTLRFLPQRWLVKIFEWSKLPVTQLLEADPTLAFEPDRHGSFPVHVAASADSMVSLIAMLTRYPACARLRNAKGQTFLHVAVEANRRHAVAFVCHLWGHREAISKSVVNIQDRNGDTALHLAVRQGALDLCRHLIGNRHTCINLENNDGETPMDLAAREVKSGFYFGLSAPRRILSVLTFADAQIGSRRRDMVLSKNPRLEETNESQKIKDFAQIVGIGSVLVATATFTAALTMPGGVWTPGDAKGTNKLMVQCPPPPAGTPVLAGSLAFDGFVISNTLAFICSTLATFSLVYCGVATVDIQKRFELVAFALALLLCSARSFCAALAFALYLLLANVSHGIAIASCVVTSLAVLDAFWFLLVSFNDTACLIARRTTRTLSKFGVRFVANILYLFWPYLLVGGYLAYDYLKISRRLGYH